MESPHAPATRLPSRRWTRRRVVWVLGLCVPAFLALVGARLFLWKGYIAEGPSMEPTLRPGERFVLDTYPYGMWLPGTDHLLVSWGAPQAGDVVVFRSPREQVEVVKRVVAVGGDTVEFRGHAVWRNGEPITTGPFGECPVLARSASSFGPRLCRQERLGSTTYTTMIEGEATDGDYEVVVVPPGHVYVLGDRRARSNDSRFFGPVAVRSVRGRVNFLYWSPEDGRIGTSIR